METILNLISGPNPSLLPHKQVVKRRRWKKTSHTDCWHLWGVPWGRYDEDRRKKLAKQSGQGLPKWTVLLSSPEAWNVLGSQASMWEGTLPPYFLLSEPLPGSCLWGWNSNPDTQPWWKALEMDMWSVTEEMSYILPLISAHFLKHFPLPTLEERNVAEP